MIFRSLDKNGDWNYGHGLSSYLTGNSAIAANIRTRLLSWVGDCFFDTAAGVDWKNRLGSKNQRQLLESDVKRIILTSYGVTGLTAFATVLNGRALTITATVNTIFSKGYQLSVTMGVTQNA